MFSLFRNHRGITLLETVIYIGLFAIIMPATVVFFLQFTQSGETFTRRAQMEQSASVILSHFNTELSRANAWNISSSILGSANGTFVYTNVSAENVTIDRPTDVVDFDGTPQNVNRLRMTIGTNPAEWITPRDINVTTFQLDEVTDGLGTTTGLNLLVEFDMLNPDGSPFRQANFSSQTTFVLRPSTVSL